MKVYLFALLVCGVSFASGLKASSTASFDYLLLSQFWPAASCTYFHMRNESCAIPANVTGWTIHGLWPSTVNGSEPQDCSDEPFNYTEIKTLSPQLNTSWPFYGTKDPPTYLWKHEWVKHGTCALSLKVISGELNYFNGTLQLHSTLNTYEALAKSNIIPSVTKAYKPDDVVQALYQSYKMYPVVVCEWDNTAKKAYFSEIHLCFDKHLQMKNCPPVDHRLKGSSGGYLSQCRTGEDTYYMPYKSPSLF